MTDDELRGLERAARAEGGPARLRYAHALERAGRSEDAWRVKLAALDDPDVRREVASPAWESWEGGPGDARFLDVPGLEMAPRQRFSVNLGESGHQLLASPLGIVRRLKTGGSIVLDQDGEIRYRIPHAETAFLRLCGELVVVREERRLFARDLGTGEPAEGVLPLDAGAVRIDGDLLVIAEGPRVLGLAWPAALERRDVRFDVTLEAPLRNLEKGSGTRLLLTRAAIFLSTQVEHVVLDRATGKVVHAGPGDVVRADAEGHVVQHEWSRHAADGRWQPGENTVHDARGARLWSSDVGRHALALAPSFVVLGTVGGGAFDVVDRATGAVRSSHQPGGYAPVVVARDVITFNDHAQGLTAVSPDGDVRFRFPLDRRERWTLVPGRRRLVAENAADGRVVCLEESA